MEENNENKTESHDEINGNDAIKTEKSHSEVKISEGFLQSESESEANARLAAAKEKTRLADLELKRLDEVEKHARIQKEIDQRQAASAENFRLGQTAEESISGQDPLFVHSALKAESLILPAIRTRSPAVGTTNTKFLLILYILR